MINGRTTIGGGAFFCFCPFGRVLTCGGSARYEWGAMNAIIGSYQVFLTACIAGDPAPQDAAWDQGRQPVGGGTSALHTNMRSPCPWPFSNRSSPQRQKARAVSNSVRVSTAERAAAAAARRGSGLGDRPPSTMGSRYGGSLIAGGSSAQQLPASCLRQRLFVLL